MRLSARGVPGGSAGRIVGRITRASVAVAARADFFRVVSTPRNGGEDLVGYAAVLVEGEPGPVGGGRDAVHGFDSMEFLKDDYLAVLEPASGRVQVVYRPESPHNFLFATERCSNTCLMCSQPPRDTSEEHESAELLRIIDLIPNRPDHLGITGGEPTLLGNGLVDVVTALARRLPGTAVTMLSNGRMYCYESFVKQLAGTGHQRFITSIPLHGDNASDHDFVAQVRGAFDQTIQGLYNAARHDLGVEIRVVLHKLTVPLLGAVVEFVYRNLPFVQHVALMGLEDMGLARTNREALWMDPIDYVKDLEAAVRYCWYRRMPISIYNLPLCVLPSSLWGFARQSISDSKTAFVDECSACRVRSKCSGMFESGLQRPSRALHAQ